MTTVIFFCVMDLHYSHAQQGKQTKRAKGEDFMQQELSYKELRQFLKEYRANGGQVRCPLNATHEELDEEYKRIKKAEEPAEEKESTDDSSSGDDDHTSLPEDERETYGVKLLDIDRLVTDDGKPHETADDLMCFRALLRLGGEERWVKFRREYRGEFKTVEPVVSVAGTTEVNGVIRVLDWMESVYLTKLSMEDITADTFINDALGMLDNINVRWLAPTENNSPERILATINKVRRFVYGRLNDGKFSSYKPDAVAWENDKKTNCYIHYFFHSSWEYSAETDAWEFVLPRPFKQIIKPKDVNFISSRQAFMLSRLRVGSTCRLQYELEVSGAAKFVVIGHDYTDIVGTVKLECITPGTNYKMGDRTEVPLLHAIPIDAARSVIPEPRDEDYEDLMNDWTDNNTDNISGDSYPFPVALSHD